MIKTNVQKALGVTALLLTVSCGSTDGNGNVETGPLGQQPLLTETVQTVVQTGMSACLDLKTNGQPIATLASQGFAQTRRGYVRRIDNPRILIGGSRITVSTFNDRCTVNATPAFPVEITTIRNLARDALTAKGLDLDASLRSGTKSGVGFVEVTF